MNRSVDYVAPATEPVTTAEAKEHLGIPSGDTSWDTKVGEMIAAARFQFETDTQLLTVSRSIPEDLDTWPDDDYRFYYRPVISLDSITYYDTANASQTLSSSIYSLDKPNRKIALAVDQDYPDIETRWDAITVTYTAGHATTPEIYKQAILLRIDINFEDRGTQKDKSQTIRAYDALVDRYQRASYP